VTPPPEALIFDVDGTLAETEEAHRLAFNAAFAEAGLDWVWGPEIYRDLLKVTGGKERMSHFHPAASAALIANVHARKTMLYAARVAAGDVPLRPGIKALITEARRRGVRLAIATTTSRPNIDALIGATLGSAAITWFKSIACGDDVPVKKPAPDVYTLALDGLDLPASRAVAIEDSWNGVQSAKSAGLRVIATPSVYSAADDFADADIVCEPEAIAARLGWT
jgi:HAD superfamily hydrolase (TIGR01509 family)